MFLHIENRCLVGDQTAQWFAKHRPIYVEFTWGSCVHIRGRCSSRPPRQSPRPPSGVPNTDHQYMFSFHWEAVCISENGVCQGHQGNHPDRPVVCQSPIPNICLVFMEKLCIYQRTVFVKAAEGIITQTSQWCAKHRSPIYV